MRSGLTKLGYAGISALLLIPVAIIFCVRAGTHSYCAKYDQEAEDQAVILAQVAAMEGALQQARSAIRSIAGFATHDFTEAEAVGRWLHETANQQHLTFQNLTLKRDPSANPQVPTFIASFRIEQPLSQIILFLHNLQTPARMVVFDTVRLRMGDPGKPRPYVADITLHVYALSGLTSKSAP